MSDSTSTPIQVLAYSTKHRLEQSTVRCLGVLGLVISIPSIIQLFVSAIEFAFFTVPPWVVWLINESASRISSNPLEAADMIWTATHRTLLIPMMSIILFAGSIGCLRKYPRARAWMILYAILLIVDTVFDQLFSIRLRWLEWAEMSYRSYYRLPKFNLSDVLMQSLHQIAIHLAFPILILWFMTRRYVSEMYRQRLGDD